MTVVDSPFLTVPEVARRLRMTERHVRLMLAEGRMPGYKPMGWWRIDRGEFEAWLRAGGNSYGER